jgi:hypothetical protein
MALIGTFEKSSAEVKLYTVDYTRWLDTNEVIEDVAVAISPLTSPSLQATGAFIVVGGKQVKFYLQSGVLNQVYIVRLVVSTSNGQVKESTIQVTVVRP